MKILVTGASGFIGRAVVAELLKENHEVVCLLSSRLQNTEDLPNVLRGDVSDLVGLTNELKETKIEAVIHAAGLAHQFGKVADEEFWKINVKGTENVARVAVGLAAKHFVLISSVAVYGKAESNSGFKESDICRPKGIYAKSKYEAEMTAREVCEKNDLKLTILRPATVIGEGDRGNTARLISAIEKGRFFWIGKGENRKSLIYKKDVARACLYVLEGRTKETEVFNITGEPVKMNFIVSEISKNLNRKIPKFSVSEDFLKKIFRLNSKTFQIGTISKFAETVEKWISEDIYSGEKVARCFGFRAETTFSEAIRRQTEFYRQNLKAKNE